MFTGVLFGFWFIWDLIPLGSMLIIHYKNFNSFGGDEEILFTEYSVDDPRTTAYSHVNFTESHDFNLLQRSMDPSRSANNPLESSGINMVDTTERDSVDEELEISSDEDDQD